MKILVMFTLSILAISAATDKDQWLQFKEKYGRDYRNLREENRRFSIFQSNLRTIEEHNEKYAKGETSYYLGVTRFSDLTPSEFRSMFNSSRPTGNLKLGTFNKAAAAAVPSAIDWRDREVVSPVKTQGSCGACWAFSATGALEAAYAIKNSGKSISLSEQNLIDCTKNLDYNNDGCVGGSPHHGFEYVKDKGIEAESNYPYQEKEETCTYSDTKRALKISNYVGLTYGIESELQQAVGTIGPVSAAIDYRGFQSYKGGIYDDDCTLDTNHAVLVVGYGETDGKEYWIVKDSQGPNWGESGYFRIARNKNKCGIASFGVYPVI